MNKTELVNVVSEAIGESKKSVETVIDAMVEAIKKHLSVSEEKVNIAGLCSFQSKTKPARDGRNPRTGLKIRIPAKKSVQFKASKGLLDALNESESHS